MMIYKRSICIYTEKDMQIGNFYDKSSGGEENLKRQDLYNLCNRCKFKNNCQIFNTTSWRFFSKKQTTKYIKW